MPLLSPVPWLWCDGFFPKGGTHLTHYTASHFHCCRHDDIVTSVWGPSILNFLPPLPSSLLDDKILLFNMLFHINHKAGCTGWSKSLINHKAGYTAWSKSLINHKAGYTAWSKSLINHKAGYTGWSKSLCAPDDLLTP
jgi:hypothetical protein